MSNKVTYVHDCYGNMIGLYEPPSDFFEYNESLELVSAKEEVCEHKPKKVVVSVNLKFYVCEKCKADLGNAL
jgi:hypothetical protein